MKGYYIVIGLALLFGCKTVQKSQSSRVDTTTKADSSLSHDALTTLTQEYYGDELKGKVPVNLAELPEYDSLVIPVESNGVQLSVTIKPHSVSYHAKVKPVARSTLSKQEHSVSQHQTQVQEHRKEKLKVKEKPFGIRLPWWIWMILILAALYAVLRLLKIVQNPFKLF